MFFRKQIILGAIAAMAVMPASAQAGTTIATTNVVMQAGTLCLVSGSTISPGTFNSGNTWRAASASVGLNGQCSAAQDTAVSEPRLGFMSVFPEPWFLDKLGEYQ